jgi:apolipoprotein N-acyltransferase
MSTPVPRSTDLTPLGTSGATIQSAAGAGRATALFHLWLVPGFGGMLTAAAFLDFRLHFLAWIAFVPVLIALTRTRSSREARAVGLAAGLGANVPAFYWLVYTMHVFGGFPYPIAAFFYLCLSTYAALQLMLFAAAVRAIGLGPLGLAAPVVWVALEFLYPNLFPWRMANTQFPLPVLVQIGDLTGPFGLSFVILWVSAAIVLALGKPRRVLPLAAAGAALLLVCVYGWFRMAVVEAAVDAAPVVRAGLVQGNIGIREKGNVAYFDINVERYRRLSKAIEAEVDVLIWPESVAQWWVSADAASLDEEDNPFPELKSFLVFGGLAYRESPPLRSGGGSGRGLEGTVEKYNSAFLIDPAARVLGRYDKRILLPFGEYLPGASLLPFLAELSPQSGDFTSGRRLATLDVPGKVRIAPLICYEDVPASIARGMTREGAEALLTIFNDAWFGPTAAPYQHEALALWRAVENRRFFVRVGNAGVTGVIDPLGRVVDRLGLFTEETLVAEIRPLRIATFYTRWGDAFAWLVVAAAVAMLAHARATRRRSS